MTSTSRSTADISQRKVVLTAGFGLLFIAVLSPFANFFVLEDLVVSANATATANNVIASEGLFRTGIAALVIVVMLDVVVTWALYVLLRPVNSTLAMFVASLRLIYAAVLAAALVNLFDAAQLLGGADYVATVPAEQLHTQAMSSIASFENGWDVGLAVFGLHLVGLGVLLFRSPAFPRFLGGLVILAGGGYLFDSFGRILISDYALTVSVFTFVGEALLIPWFIWMGTKGFSSDSEGS